MAFTTLEYICFFAVVFFVYHALPHRFRWLLLLVASWVFYAYATPYFLMFLALTTVVTYGGAIAIDANLRRQDAWLAVNKQCLDRDAKKIYKAGMERQRKWMVTGVVVVLIGLLVAFKYLSFLFKNIACLGGTVGLDFSLPSVNLILPIGLSFYIFQSLGYCIDVERGVVTAERNFLKHALFISYFPQILQGPIGDYGRLAHQFYEEHPFDYEQAVFGLQRVVWGFFKKLCVANIIADRINPCWTHVSDYPGAIAWGAILFLYAIQLYADFSGYMDIACGCSQMFGIKLDENFDCSYFSKSITEFWRRWHITLGSWFKNYVFYPLLRSDALMVLRKHYKGREYLSNTIPTLIALFVVWLLIGLWHGADWSYVVYGLYHGFFVMLALVMTPVYDRFHKRFPGLVESKPYIAFQMARTFLIVVIGYAIFKPADLGTTSQIVKQSLLGLDCGGIYQMQYTLHHSFIKVFGWMGLMFIVDVLHYTHENGFIRGRIAKLPLLMRWTIYLVGLWLMIFLGLYGSGFDQFEYFKF